MSITIEEAFLIRKRIKELPKFQPLKNTIENILFGYYDQYKDEALEIALSDVEFMESNR